MLSVEHTTNGTKVADIFARFSSHATAQETPERARKKKTEREKENEDREAFKAQAFTFMIKFSTHLQSIRSREKDINGFLSQKFHFEMDDLVNAVTAWMSDEVHGANHSYALYVKYNELEARNVKLGSEPSQVSDNLVRIGCIIHDFGEFVPLYFLSKDKFGQRNTEVPQQKYHDAIIAKVMKEVTHYLIAQGEQIDIQDARQFIFDISRHDYFWSSPSPEEMDVMNRKRSQFGRDIADADRLAIDKLLMEKMADKFGNYFTDLPQEERLKMFEFLQALEKNRLFSEGNGYVIRDLLASFREKWGPRTGRMFDSLCALFREFLAPEYLLSSEAAREEHREKRRVFTQVLIEYYTKSYRNGWKLIQSIVGPSAHGERAKPDAVMYVAAYKKDKKTQQYEVWKELPTEFSDSLTQPLHEMSIHQLRELFNSLLSIPITLEESERDDRPLYKDLDSFGYSLLIEQNGVQFMLDPSILRFESEEELVAALMKAASEYEDLMEQKAA